MTSIARLLAEDAKEKRACLPRTTTRSRPRRTRVEAPPWWKVAPDVVRVEIATGRVLVWRWPLKS